MGEEHKGRRPGGSPHYYKGVLALATIPFYLGVAPLVGWFLGRWVDGKTGLEPLFQAIGVGLGIVAGIRETVRLVRIAQKDLDRKR